jgi:zinc transport system substrate-binding protein
MEGPARPRELRATSITTIACSVSLPTMRARGVAASLTLLICIGSLVACGGSPSRKIDVVASFYPLAWVARQVGGPNVNVEDLTGVEARDVGLSAGQRSDLETANLVLILGRFGFQPQVESAAGQTSGKVVSVTTGMRLTPSGEPDLRYDPNVWLDPVLMERIVQEITSALASVDPAHAASYRRRGATTGRALSAIADAYATGLGNCRFKRFVTTRDAFGYTAQRYGLDEFPLQGLVPQPEPSAARIRMAVDAIRAGTAAPAIFYEDTVADRSIAQRVAAEVGAPAHPLGTIESEPASGDYLSIMRANLQNLEIGLRCV